MRIRFILDYEEPKQGRDRMLLEEAIAIGVAFVVVSRF